MRAATIPCVMENVRGISVIARKQGRATSICFQSILAMGVIMKMPTMTSTGAVVKSGNMDSKGDRNKNGRKNNPANSAVSPVRAPCWIPAALSI